MGGWRFVQIPDVPTSVDIRHFKRGIVYLDMSPTTTPFLRLCRGYTYDILVRCIFRLHAITTKSLLRHTLELPIYAQNPEIIGNVRIYSTLAKLPQTSQHLSHSMLVQYHANHLCHSCMLNQLLHPDKQNPTDHPLLKQPTKKRISMKHAYNQLQTPKEHSSRFGVPDTAQAPPLLPEKKINIYVPERAQHSHFQR